MSVNPKILTRIIEELQSVHDRTVLDAIALARQKGDHTVIPPLVKLLEHPNPDVKNKVRETLFDLRDKNAVVVILDQFDHIKDTDVRNLLLQSLWQSNIQPVNHLSRLVSIAINGTLEECIEVYSIITNMEDVEIPESESMESLFRINNSINEVKNPPQKQLLKDIVIFLNEKMA